MHETEPLNLEQLKLHVNDTLKGWSIVNMTISCQHEDCMSFDKENNNSKPQSAHDLTCSRLACHISAFRVTCKPPHVNMFLRPVKYHKEDTNWHAQPLTHYSQVNCIHSPPPHLRGIRISDVETSGIIISRQRTTHHGNISIQKLPPICTLHIVKTG